MSNTANKVDLISFEEGWNDEIKTKVCLPLHVMLSLSRVCAMAANFEVFTETERPEGVR